MLNQRTEDAAIICNYPAVRECVIASGGAEPDVARLLSQHLLQVRRAHRVLRQVHIITDSSGLPPNAYDAFVKAGASIHRANGERTECLTFVHTLRMAEISDVLSLFVTDAGYLPMIRDAKTLGCRVELYAVWTSNPALFAAADEVVAMHPVPGAPLVFPKKLSAAA